MDTRCDEIMTIDMYQEHIWMHAHVKRVQIMILPKEGSRINIAGCVLWEEMGTTCIVTEAISISMNGDSSAQQHDRVVWTLMNRYVDIVSQGKQFLNNIWKLRKV